MGVRRNLAIGIALASGLVAATLGVASGRVEDYANTMRERTLKASDGYNALVRGLISSPDRDHQFSEDDIMGPSYLLDYMIDNHKDAPVQLGKIGDDILFSLNEKRWEHYENISTVLAANSGIFSFLTVAAGLVSTFYLLKRETG